MENQNPKPSKSKPQSQQSQSSSPGVSGSRTRQENTQKSQDATNTESNDNAVQPQENSQPKFQSKHKNRNVAPPQKKTANKENANAPQPSQPAGQAAGTGTSPSPNQPGTQQQPGGTTPSAAGNVTQPADAGGQSSKLGVQTEEPSPETSGSNGSGSVLPPDSHLSSLDGDKKPKSSGGKKKWLVIVVVAVLLVLGVGGYVAYAQYVAPRQAPVSYIQKLADMRSGQFQLEVSTITEDSDSGSDAESGSESGSGESSLSRTSPEDRPVPEMNLRAEGEFSENPDNAEDYRFASTVDVEYGQSFFSIDQSFDFRAHDKTGYIRFNSTDLLSFLFPGIQPNQWYSWEVSSGEESSSDSFSSRCSKEDQDALTEYFENGLKDDIEITNPQRNDWIGTERGGDRVRHYSGEIKGDSLVGVIQGAAEATSDKCLTTEDVDEADVNKLNFAYDLYAGDNQDEMVVRMSEDGEEQIEATLITSGYNEEVNISIPEDSTPFQELLDDRNGSFSPGLDNGGSSPPSSGDSLFESNLQ